MKRDDRFRKFSRWGKEYFAFSCSARELNAVKGYISGQREHHGLVSFEDEINAGFGVTQNEGWASALPNAAN